MAEARRAWSLLTPEDKKIVVFCLGYTPSFDEQDFTRESIGNYIKFMPSME